MELKVVIDRVALDMGYVQVFELKLIFCYTTKTYLYFVLLPTTFVNSLICVVICVTIWLP